MLERIVYRELVKLNIPVSFQSTLLGARPGGTPLGGLIADFVLLDRPLVVQVMGRVWHEGRSATVRDALQADELRLRGWESVFLWDHVIESETLLRRWLRDNVRHLLARNRTPVAATRIKGRSTFTGRRAA